jgi:hypothetical protein
MRRLLACLVFLALLLMPLGLRQTAHAAVNPFDDACSEFEANPSTAGTRPDICTENDADKNKTLKELNPISGSGGIITRVIRLLSFIIGVASVIIIIYSSLKYILSNGDSGKVNTAKESLLYAFIGLVISLAAQGIVYMVVTSVK